MRQRSKVLVLIFSIFFLFSVQIIAFIPISVKAEENDYIDIVGDQTIRYDWLTITMAEDDNDYLRHNIGGIDLISYQNLDSEESGENTLTFMSRIVFGYEINSYLALSLRDVFPDLKTNKKSSEITYATMKITTLTLTKMHYGKFAYDYVYYSAPNYHDYYHNIPITIGINPTFSALDGEIINRIPIETSEYLYEVKAMDVVLTREGFCGDYNDLYTTQPKLSGGVDTLTLTDELSYSQQVVVDKIESLDLGWETGDMTSDYVTKGITIQQWLVDSFTKGDQRTNTGTGDLIYNYPIRLAPEITRTQQRIDVRRGGFDYNAFFNFFPTIYSIETFSIYRDISVHVRCPFVHIEYETAVYLICNVKLDAEIYESALNDPFFRKGDWLWDPIINSYDPVVVVLPTVFDDIEDWWEEYGWIVILIVISIAGIYLFIQIGMPLILKKQAVDVVRRR